LQWAGLFFSQYYSILNLGQNNFSDKYMADEQKRKHVVIYKAAKSEIKVEALLKNETIWLSQKQMANVFNVDVRTVNEHLKNIFNSGELNKNSTIRKFRIVRKEGKRNVAREVEFYNLDAIISVGYRVNSKKATQFRIWATGVLRDHILKGYTINDRVLINQADNFRKLQETISFLQEKTKRSRLVGQEQEIMNLLAEYSHTLTILEKYDKGRLNKIKGKKPSFVLDYSSCSYIIGNIKKELVAKKEASEFFGKEAQERKLEGVINGLYQTFGQKELYPGIESKASHLLYFIIKDHPFIDGNKRISSFLFVYFLDANNYLYHKSGERKISDNALTALALLVAESDPQEKDTLISLIENLIKTK
jgi:prophage maintenance system killer protein